jgi:trans-2,3-dihydro-3-hydroxyanthranilate isomerase
VFTSTPLAGNGLAVVHDADGLDEAAMLGFARETKLSETTFVQSGDDDCDYRNRIWMMTGELPMAGHPSLGTAVAVARRAGERSASYVQRTPAGLQPVDVELDGRVARASMLQERPDFGAELDPARVLAAIGLSASDAAPDLPVQRVSTGLGHVLAPLRDAEALSRCRPDFGALDALLAEHDAATVYAVVCDHDAEHAGARAFFTSPGGIVEEDPATGSAGGPLLMYLHERRGVAALTIDQGVQMGRRSRLEAALEGDRPRVGGEVVIIAEGVLAL